jgi:O-antigen/teichoic acid export membrane protein
MLLKNSGYYLLARGLPGIVNFLAIAIYTRMLLPDEYGRYALVIAGVGLFNVVFFEWLKLSLNRFMPAYLENPKPLLATILAVFTAITLITGVFGLFLAGVFPDPAWQRLIMLAVPLLWAQGWFELNLTLSAVKLLPLRYGLMSGIKAASALALGVVLVLWGFGEYGPLIGLLAGITITAAILGREEWSGVSLDVSRPLLGEILRYGLPLTATFALTFVISSSDRFIIAWLLGEGPAGLYSAAYDLGQQSLTLLMVVVNLAGYPLAIRALEQKGVESAQEQLRQNSTLLIFIAFPAAVGMAVLAPNVSRVMLGAGFREDAALLLPWVALAVLLSGIRAYHFDLAFQLGRHTMGQVWVMGTGAFLNILLNILLIPIYGLLGAAYATFGAYLLALIVSATLGRRTFNMPVPYLDGFKIAAASLLMGLPLWLSLEYQGIYALGVQVLGGCIVYLFFLCLLDAGGYRTNLLRQMRSWIGS